MRITADHIVGLLAAKHCKDTVIPECKTGPSQFTGCLRIDVWVMANSWTQPTITAYEIKVSRSDFRGDKKWRGYLDYCNEFYFVCPSDLISATEVPDEAGLLWVARTGSRLYTKKKAPYRSVDIPDTLWRYLLMWRTCIVEERNKFLAKDRGFWEQWLKDKTVDAAFGQHVGRSIRHRIEAEIKNVRTENKKLQERIEACAVLEKKLQEMGVEADDWNPAYTAKQKLQELTKIIPRGLKFQVGSLIDKLGELNEAIEAKEPI